MYSRFMEAFKNNLNQVQKSLGSLDLLNLQTIPQGPHRRLVFYFHYENVIKTKDTNTYSKPNDFILMDADRIPKRKLLEDTPLIHYIY